MAFLAAVRNNLLVRASVATVAGFVLLGVASGALPVQCFTGLAACRSVDDTAKLTDTAVAPAATPAVVKVATAAPAAPTLTKNDVIAGSFARLNVDLEALPTGELTKRVVKTVAIGPDGLPVTNSPAKAVAKVQPPEPVAEVKTAEVAPVASRTEPPARKILIKPLFPETVEAAPLAYTASAAKDAKQSSAEVATTEVASAEQPAPAKAKTSGSKAVVKGSGVNVRSAPSKGKSKVMFALAPGAVVTVSDNQRGWLKVSDSKGRSGWVYEDFVTRQ